MDLVKVQFSIKCSFGLRQTKKLTGYNSQVMNSRMETLGEVVRLRVLCEGHKEPWWQDICESLITRLCKKVKLASNKLDGV